MKKLAMLLMSLLTRAAYGDLGIMVNPNEILAKTGASNAGISQIYDHPNQVSNGQFYVPIVYNGNTGAEVDPHMANSDIDYIPLTQMKGMNGTAGAPGVAGAAGQTGSSGQAGTNGVNGTNGKDGRDGKNADLRTQMEIEGILRLYDGKRFVIEAFDNYSLRDNHNNAFGGRLTYKIGKSYETRKTEALQSRLDALERNLALMQVIE